MSCANERIDLLCERDGACLAAAMSMLPAVYAICAICGSVGPSAAKAGAEQARSAAAQNRAVLIIISPLAEGHLERCDARWMTTAGRRFPACMQEPRGPEA